MQDADMLRKTHKKTESRTAKISEVTTQSDASLFAQTNVIMRNTQRGVFEVTTLLRK